MSLDEVQRAIDIYNKRKKDELKEKATQDYQLANLIGISVSRIYSKSSKYPRIEEIYPTLFTDESKPYEQQKMALSVERFKIFAMQNNKKYSDGKEVINT